MSKVLIIYDPSLDSDILKDRIKRLGKSYTFWGNHWIIETNDTPKKIYENLTNDELYKKSSIFVVELSGKADYFYGRMNTSLWEWLKEK